MIGSGNHRFFAPFARIPRRIPVSAVRGWHFARSALSAEQGKFRERDRSGEAFERDRRGWPSLNGE